METVDVPRRGFRLVEHRSWPGEAPLDASHAYEAVHASFIRARGHRLESNAACNADAASRTSEAVRPE